MLVNTSSLIFEGGIEIIQREEDSKRISFFPQNFILKEGETKKIQITVSNVHKE